MKKLLIVVVCLVVIGFVAMYQFTPTSIARRTIKGQFNECGLDYTAELDSIVKNRPKKAIERFLSVTKHRADMYSLYPNQKVGYTHAQFAIRELMVIDFINGSQKTLHPIQRDNLKIAELTSYELTAKLSISLPQKFVSVDSLAPDGTLSSPSFCLVKGYTFYTPWSLYPAAMLSESRTKHLEENIVQEVAVRVYMQMDEMYVHYKPLHSIEKIWTDVLENYPQDNEVTASVKNRLFIEQRYFVLKGGRTVLIGRTDDAILLLETSKGGGFIGNSQHRSFVDSIWASITVNKLPHHYMAPKIDLDTVVTKETITVRKRPHFFWD